MGAQQSTGGGKNVKFRRRAATSNYMTAGELDDAGTDIAKAVYQNMSIQQQKTMQLQQLQQQQQNQQQAQQTAAAESLLPRKKAQPTMELPPWEVVASIGEEDWFALKGWFDAGWRCRKCGNVRNDGPDHPRALAVLARVGIVPPSGEKGMASPASNTSRRSGAGAMSGAITYGNESPDVGYGGSDSSSNQSSPMHPNRSRQGAAKKYEEEEAPRFHSESNTYDPSTGLHEACPAHLGRGYGASLGGGSSVSTPSMQFQSTLLTGGSDTSSISISTTGSSVLREDPGQAFPGSLMPVSMAGKSMAGKGVGECEQMRKKILAAITRTFQVYFVDKEPNGSLVFDFLLTSLLDITQSGFGFISSALLKSDGTPYLKTHAMTNVAWTPELRSWYAGNAHKGLVFTNMNTLHGSVVLTGQFVITNDAKKDPRSRGVPPGHPPLDTFMGIPLYTGTELIGIIGLANRSRAVGGYDENLLKELEPMTMTIAQIMYAVNERKRRKEAELHLSSVLQNCKETVLSLSHSGHVVSMNSAGLKLFGFQNEDEESGAAGGAAGRAAAAAAVAALPTNLMFQDVFVEAEGNVDMLHHDNTKGKLMRATARKKDGTFFPIEVSITRGVYDTVFYVAIVRDLSESQLSVRKLQEAENFWEFAQNRSSDGLWDWYVQDQVLNLSDRWFQMLGYTPGELSCRIEEFDALVHPDDKEKAYADIREYMDGLTPIYCNEHRLRCKDGNYRWFLHRGKLLSRNEEGEPWHFVGFHTDITERKNLAMLRNAADKAIRSKAELFVSLSRDIRKPLLSFLEVSSSFSPEEPPSEETIVAVQNLGAAVSDIVNNKLAVNDIATGSLEPQLSAFNAITLLEKAMDVVNSGAEAKNVEIVMEMTRGAPSVLVGDLNRTLQLFIDLLLSAVDITENGTVIVRVNGESAEGNPVDQPGAATWFIFTVSDSSEAVSVEDMFRVLGLPKKLTELLGGKMVISENTEGKPGNRVKLSLPISLSKNEVHDSAQVAAMQAYIPEELRHARILVVGQVQSTVSLLAKQLSFWNVPHNVIHCSPEEAFMSLFPAGNLPPVMSASAPPSTLRDGTPRSGLAQFYDVLIVDFSHRPTLTDPRTRTLIDLFGKDKVGVVLLLKASIAAAGLDLKDNRYWLDRKPALLKKPAGRPNELLECVMSAVESIPGNTGIFQYVSSAFSPNYKPPLYKSMIRLNFRGRVLLAKCNLIYRQVATSLLRAYGLTVEPVANGVEAVNAFQKSMGKPYDLVLMDCIMPEMDGWAASARMREVEMRTGSPRVPIVGLISAYKLKRDLDRCRKAGMTDCVAKPLTVSTLDSMLSQFFS